MRKKKIIKKIGRILYPLANKDGISAPIVVFTEPHKMSNGVELLMFKQLINVTKK
jgi:hypothetical protein